MNLRPVSIERKQICLIAAAVEHGLNVVGVNLQATLIVVNAGSFWHRVRCLYKRHKHYGRASQPLSSAKSCDPVPCLLLHLGHATKHVATFAAWQGFWVQGNELIMSNELAATTTWSRAQGCWNGKALVDGGNLALPRISSLQYVVIPQVVGLQGHSGGLVFRD